MSDTVPGTVAKRRHNPKIWITGIIAALVLAAAAGGAYWWNERSKPSQASAADCALAQKIIDGAQDLPGDKADVAKWLKDTQELRRKGMTDGYLGLQVAKYESWAADNATGEAKAPSKSVQQKTADTANSHCTDSGRTLRFPPIGS
ncbi:hypothetical protein ACWFRJ_42590 [Streptomyces sp. NPDC055239]